MKWTTLPALVPCLGVLAGVTLALQARLLPVALLAALAALGLVRGGRAGIFLAWLVLGALAGLRVELSTHDRPWLDPSRPAEVVTRVAGHPRRSADGGWLLWARSERARQGGRVVTAARELRLHLPPAMTPPAPGARLRLRGYLRRSPGFVNGPPPRPGPWRMRLESPRLATVEEPPPLWGRVAAAAHRRLSVALAAAEKPGADDGATRERPGTALVRTLVLGDAGGLPLPWVQGLRRSGLAHLTAVSGLHVGLIGAAAFLLATAAPRPLRLLLALLAVLGYLALVGPRPSALRAAAMIALALAALALERPPQGLNALAACATGLLLADPLLIVDLGFRLSFAATAAILILAPALVARWTSLPRPLRLPLAVTVAAQVATLPFTVPAFALIAPSAPVANLLATPWLAATLLASLVWALVALASPAAASALLPALEILARPLEWLASLPPGPLVTLPVAASPTSAAAIAAAVLLILLRPRVADLPSMLPFLVPRVGPLLTLAPLLLAQGHAPRPADPELTLLDVGQGEAILLRDGRRALLVDGGGWPVGDFGGRVLVPALAARGVRRLDAVLLTHGDADHCRGLVDLARYLPIGEARTSPGWLPESCAGELLAAPGIRSRPLRAGDRLTLGRWRLTVLHPPADAGRLGTNDRSLVLLAAVHGRRLLLTGDVEAGVERRLARTVGADLAVDVLKLAHHGSKTSTDRVFLRAVAPRLALVSAGRHNRFGHPAPAVLERLEDAGVRVLRTDRGGAVELRFPPSGVILLRRPGGG